jgi:uncharacterized protein YaiI (UPF0178 family)
LNVLIDADACPVTDLAIRLCRERKLPCILFCDTSHMFHREGAETVVVDKGADSADFAIANHALPGDLVITQDYGLASMCLSRGARVLHQDGWEYTADNIDALLFSRHESRKYRASGGRIKGPKKRGASQDKAFSASMQRILDSK